LASEDHDIDIGDFASSAEAAAFLNFAGHDALFRQLLDDLGFGATNQLASHGAILRTFARPLPAMKRRGFVGAACLGFSHGRRYSLLIRLTSSRLVLPSRTRLKQL
jgi:hypothetical protein